MYSVRLRKIQTRKTLNVETFYAVNIVGESESLIQFHRHY